MMRRILFALALLGAALIGFGFGMGFLPQQTKRGANVLSGIHPEREFPPVEFKSFAIVLYAQNDTAWCERSLRSIFEQDYEALRLIFVDDGSRDGTFEKVQNFIVENHQEHRALLIRNESPIGCLPSLYRAIQHCLDRELIVPLSAKDWLASPSALLSLNRAFQNPDAWIAFGRTIRYPTYEFLDPPHWDITEIEKRGYPGFENGSLHCFYSALFKQLSVQSFFEQPSGYLLPLLELCGGRVKNVWEPVAFRNEAVPILREIKPSTHRTKPLLPLAEFPKSLAPERQEADIVLFSANRPLQLYAALESIQQHVTGYRRMAVVYWADPPYVDAYGEIKASFPQIAFHPQGKEYKRSISKAIFDTPIDYILLGSDENLIKDLIDLRSCTEMLSKTRATGFFLQLQHPRKAMPLSGDTYAFHGGDERHAGNLEWALYRKADLKHFFKSARYEDYESLRSAWKEAFVGDSIYLSFNTAKATQIPALFAKEELLSKFNQGFKIDLEPLYRGETPEFVPR